MIATIHTTAPVLALDNDDDREFDQFDLSDVPGTSRTLSTPVRNFRSTSDLRILIPRLFQLNLSSLSAYVEIADQATDPELRDFAVVMTRQRMAQCRALSRFSHPVAPKSNPAVCPLRGAWLKALWSLEQDRLVAFAEHAEKAESILEEAFVEAADAVVEQPVADLLYELAINVCGARERFEELASLSAERSFA